MIYTGKSIVPGTVTGPAYIIAPDTTAQASGNVTDTTYEIALLNGCISEVIDELKVLAGDAPDIIDTHIMLLSDESDESIAAQTEAYIRDNKASAAYAVKTVGDMIAGKMAGSDSEYLRARNEDILYITDMILNRLTGRSDRLSLSEPSVIITEMISPEQIVSLGREMILGIVTVRGSALSHSAILARNLNIPFITGIDIDYDMVRDGMTVAIDGPGNTFITEPDEETISSLRQVPEDDGETVRGIAGDLPVKLYANIEGVREAKEALKNGALGIGLFRTEFLYMNRDEAPSEEEQYRIYTEVASIMGDRPVIIRTIDIRGDKKIRCPKDEGAQLRALLRASVLGNIRIMFPMISDEEQLVRIRKMINDAAKLLECEGIAYKVPQLGIMVETPAAVSNIETLAGMVDFVSIGTNDLTQYFLGIDRMSGRIAECDDSSLTEIMELIRKTAMGAHKLGIEVGICGEMAADTKLSREFVRMGIDELSMAPSRIAGVAEEIRNINI